MKKTKYINEKIKKPDCNIRSLKRSYGYYYDYFFHCLFDYALYEPTGYNSIDIADRCFYNEEKI